MQEIFRRSPTPGLKFLTALWAELLQANDILFNLLGLAGFHPQLALVLAPVTRSPRGTGPRDGRHGGY